MEDKNIVSWHCSELPTSLSPNVSGWCWELLPPGRAAGSPRPCFAPGPSRNDFNYSNHIQLQQFTPSSMVLPTWASNDFHNLSLVLWSDPCLLQPLSLFTLRDFHEGLLPIIFLQIVLPWRDKLHNRQHLLKGRCYTLSSFWFYILISVFWIKGRRVASLWFLAIFSA